MSWIGDFRLGDTFDTKFCTVSTTGAPTTLASSPVISAYPGNSTTEITAGITLTVDFDGRTGLHNVRVVATGGNGYATATNYQLVITTGTVGGTSVVGYVVAEFSIEARSALMPTTAARTLVVDAAGLADANTVKVGATGAGTAQTARDLGASVLLSAGTGTGQLDFTSGVVKANATQFAGQTITAAAGVTLPSSVASPTNITAATGVDVTKWNGTAVTAPNTAGTPVVDVGRINNVATTPVTTVKAVQGLTTADVVASVSGNVLGSVASLAANAIAAGVFTSGALTRSNFAADTGIQSLRSNTAQAGAATTITLDAGASAIDNFYNNALLQITGGTGVGQSRFISAYVGATKVATVATWVTNPDNTSTFAIHPFDAVAGASAPTAAQNATAVWQDLTASGDFGTAGSIGALLKLDVDATISSRTKPADTQAAVTLVTTTTTVTNTVNADVKKINGTTVNGNGAGTPWGP